MSLGLCTGFGVGLVGLGGLVVLFSFLGLSLPSFVWGLSAALLVGCLGCCVLFGPGVPPGGVWFGKADLLGWFGGAAEVGRVSRWVTSSWLCLFLLLLRLSGRIWLGGGGSLWFGGGGLGFGLVLLGLADGAGSGGCLGFHCHQPSLWFELQAKGIPLDYKEGMGLQVVQGWCLCDGEEPGVGSVEGCKASPGAAAEDGCCCKWSCLSHVDCA